MADQKHHQQSNQQREQQSSTRRDDERRQQTQGDRVRDANRDDDAEPGRSRERGQTSREPSSVADDQGIGDRSRPNFGNRESELDDEIEVDHQLDDEDEDIDESGGSRR